MADQAEPHTYVMPIGQSARDAVIKAAYLARRARVAFSIEVPGAGRFWPVDAHTGTRALRNHIDTIEHMRTHAPQGGLRVARIGYNGLDYYPDKDQSALKAATTALGVAQHTDQTVTVCFEPPTAEDRGHASVDVRPQADVQAVAALIRGIKNDLLD